MSIAVKMAPSAGSTRREPGLFLLLADILELETPMALEAFKETARLQHVVILFSFILKRDIRKGSCALETQVRE